VTTDEATFRGRTVVVTGASAGIGRALCLALAPQRPRLVLAARDEARLQAVAGECRSLDAEALVVPTDVTSQEDCRRLITRTIAELHGIDVLVNNAGTSMYSQLEDVQDLSIYERLIRVNYLSCVYLTSFALPHLRRSRGRIVVVASVAGLTGVPTRSGYCASKHAVFGFFDSLRIELADAGVSVTVVAPDFVVSEIHERSYAADGSPVGRVTIRQAQAMPTEQCARIIVDAMARRKRLVITSLRGRLGRLIRPFAPGLIDRMAARAIRRGR
jgi:short-subunit dehydrogenase